MKPSRALTSTEVTAEAFPTEPANFPTLPRPVGKRNAKRAPHAKCVIQGPVTCFSDQVEDATDKIAVTDISTLFCTLCIIFNHFLPASVQFRRQEKEREQSVVKYQSIPFVQNQSQAQTSNMSYFFPIYQKYYFRLKTTKIINEPRNKAL
jgi:hypothetical protein